MPTGTAQTYDLTVGVMLDYDPLIRMLDPTEVPLQSGVGSDGNTVLSMESCFEKKIEWQDDTILVPRSTLAATTTTTQTTIVVATGHGIRFQTGDALLLEAEQVRVTGISTDTLTVTRAFAGSSGAQHNTATDVVNLGATQVEGSDPPAARFQDRVNRHNFTQIFGPTAVQVSGTENAVRKYGISTNEFDYQSALRMKEEVIKLEQALLYGTRFEDTGAELREMGGLIFFITVNVNTTTTNLTDTNLLDSIQACWDVGGGPNKCAVGSIQKRKISNFNSSDIRLGRADVGRGKTVDYFDSDFGRVDFVLHRRVRTADLFLYNREQATIKTLRPFQLQMLAKTGDSVKGMVVGEKTLKFEADRWAARFSALQA